ncbi:hypothetical protein, partial [Moraxella catarrhalis]|uniref:hypothetical protein n=1 Tax=Moraxella catarrhalis TaxID=480 RepID=UPI000A91D52D
FKLLKARHERVRVHTFLSQGIQVIIAVDTVIQQASCVVEVSLPILLLLTFGVFFHLHPLIQTCVQERELYF